MPVNTAEALVCEESPRPSGEGLVVEHVLKDAQDIALVTIAALRILIDDLLHDCLHILCIGNASIEVALTRCVCLEQAFVTALPHLTQKAVLFQSVFRNVVAIEKARNVPVRIEQIAELVRTEQRTSLQGIQYLQTLFIVQKSRRKNRHLALQHVVQFGDLPFPFA